MVDQARTAHPTRQRSPFKAISNTSKNSQDSQGRDICRGARKRVERDLQGLQNPVKYPLVCMGDDLECDSLGQELSRLGPPTI